MSAEENGGMKIKMKEIKVKLLLINLHVLTVVKSLLHMEIRNANIVATIVI